MVVVVSHRSANPCCNISVSLLWCYSCLREFQPGSIDSLICQSPGAATAGGRKAEGATSCVEVPDATTVSLPGRRGAAEGFKFEYDRVYRMSNPGRQMFAEVVQPLLGRFLQGFNTTVRTICAAHPPAACGPVCCSATNSLKGQPGRTVAELLQQEACQHQQWKGSEHALVTTVFPHICRSLRTGRRAAAKLIAWARRPPRARCTAAARRRVSSAAPCASSSTACPVSASTTRCP